VDKVTLTHDIEFQVKAAFKIAIWHINTHGYNNRHNARSQQSTRCRYQLAIKYANHRNYLHTFTARHVNK